MRITVEVEFEVEINDKDAQYDSLTERQALIAVDEAITENLGLTEDEGTNMVDSVQIYVDDLGWCDVRLAE